MAFKDRINKNKKDAKGIFAVIGGHRLAGKSTLAGSLPGKTLMLQTELLETGSRSAKALSEKNGYTLDIIDVKNFKDVLSILEEVTKKDYDNVYIDSLTSLLDVQFVEDGMDKLKGNNIWDGFRKLGDKGVEFLMACKNIVDNKGINIFTTIAYKVKFDSDGETVDVQYDMKGQMTLGTLHKVCPIIVTVGKVNTEKDGLVRCLYTYDNGKYPGRIDYLLEEDNPKIIKPDLSLVLKLVNC